MRAACAGVATNARHNVINSAVRKFIVRKLPVRGGGFKGNGAGRRISLIVQVNLALINTLL
jgi:hypothetical protein